jgi:hypothetical protein
MTLNGETWKLPSPPRGVRVEVGVMVEVAVSVGDTVRVEV